MSHLCCLSIFQCICTHIHTLFFSFTLSILTHQMSYILYPSPFPLCTHSVLGGVPVPTHMNIALAVCRWVGGWINTSVHYLYIVAFGCHANHQNIYLFLHQILYFSLFTNSCSVENSFFFFCFFPLRRYRFLRAHFAKFY